MLFCSFVIWRMPEKRFFFLNQKQTLFQKPDPRTTRSKLKNKNTPRVTEAYLLAETTGRVWASDTVAKGTRRESAGQCCGTAPPSRLHITHAPFPVYRSLWLLSAERSWEERSPLGMSESSPRSRWSQFSEVKGRISWLKSKYFFLQQTLRW